jgi:predicted branched-subunit amino acid permease
MSHAPDRLPRPEDTGRSTACALFVGGALDLLPLWAGAIPSGMAYGMAARDAGLGAGETQLMSLVVFSAAGQVAAVSLLDTGAPAALLVATVMAINAQLLLLGVAVGRQLTLSAVERLGVAWFLTDGAYGVVAARGRLSLPALLGAGLSMFVAWNLGTVLGVAVGDAVAGARRLGIHFVVPLTFLAVLVPLLRTRAAVTVALVSAVLALLLSRLLPIGVAVLGAGVAGSAVGAWGTRHEGQPGAAGRLRPRRRR